MQRSWSIARVGGALVALCLLLAGFMAQAGPAAAYSATFANNAPIALNTTGPNNTPPNPSTINVSGFATGIQSLTVTTFNSSRSVTLNLSGPTAGQNYTFTIEPGTTQTIIDPTNNNSAGTSPNGLWTLSVVSPQPAADPASPDSIAGGWSLFIVAQPAPTTTTVTATPNPSVYGTASYTLTATVLATTIQQQPTGTVRFFITPDATGVETSLGTVALSPTNAGNQSSATLIYNANLSPTPATLQPGTYMIRARYVGNDDFAASGDRTTLTIGKATTTTTQVTATPSTFAYGTNPIGFSALVTNTSNNAPLTGGSVRFVLTNSANATICDQTGALNPNGTNMVTVTASCLITYSQISAGNYTLTATYSGDANFTVSVGSSTNPVVITKANTSLALTAVNYSATCGDTSVLVSALLQNASNNGGFASPSGDNGSVTISILNSSNVVIATQTIPVSTSNQNYTANATLNIGSARTGTYTVTASYSGSDQFNGSTAPSRTLTISPSNTTTVIITSPITATYGDASVTLKASANRAAPASGVVTSGTVTFTVKKGTAMIGTVNGNVVNGVVTATFPLNSTIGAGSYTFTAVYNGDDCYNTSSATSNGTLTVAKRILWIKPVDQTRTSTQANPGCSKITDIEPYFETNGQPPVGTGLAYGDTLASSVRLLSGFSCSYSIANGTVARPTPAPTTGTISVNGVFSDNYDIRSKTGKLTVTR